MNIPPGFRYWVAQRTGAGMARALATGYYDRCAERVLSMFDSRGFVREATVRGGYLERLQPGISDIDFTVIVEDARASRMASRLLELGTPYDRLRKTFKVPGEVVLVDERGWKMLARSGSALWLLQARRRDRSGRERREPISPIRAGSRFAFCLQFYVLAWTHRERAPRSNYAGCRRDKDLAKVGRYGEEKVVTFSEAFRVLDGLARRCGIAETTGELPGIFELDPQFSPVDFGRRSSRSPLLVSPAMSHCIRRGWSWWNLATQRRIFRQLGPEFRDAIRDRAHSLLPRLFGALLWENRPDVITDFCDAVAWLSQSHGVRLKHLEQFRAQWPECGFNDYRGLTELIVVRNEALDFLESTEFALTDDNVTTKN